MDGPLTTRLGALAATLAVCACAGDAPPRGGVEATDTSSLSPAPPLVLVDSAIPPAVAGEAGWNYEESAVVELTGDGRPERVVLTARVELYRGRPAWDDGQPWQVYVEAPDGTRTYVYARRLQLGTLTMRIGRGTGGAPSTIVLLEHLPDRLSVYEASYPGPGRISASRVFQRELDPRGAIAGPKLP